MNILYVTPEAVPFVRTGGLGDVAGSLPSALSRKGAQVRVILPLYRSVAEKWRGHMRHCLTTYVPMSRRMYCGLLSMEKDGVTWYFVENESCFDRDAVYGCADDGERFAFFSAAVVQLLPMLGWHPDVLVCNGWQTAPVIVRLRGEKAPVYRSIRTVYTIHDVEEQGCFPAEQSRSLLGMPENGSLCHEGQLNFMKAAVCAADLLTAVSPGYARQLCMDNWNLGKVLEENAFKLRGILNGIDPKIYDPATDPLTYCAFSREDLSGKAVNKRQLQRELGLDMDESMPLIACVSRIVERRGMALVARGARTLARRGCQLVVVGSGEPELEALFAEAAQQQPEQVAFVSAYREELAARVYAGADILLMPSRYEPCGLPQMIAMRYGTVPVVRDTGGLRDTVCAWPAAGSNGLRFSYYTTEDMLTALQVAVELWRRQPEQWRALMLRCMQADFSWEKPAEEYIKIYEMLVRQRD